MRRCIIAYQEVFGETAYGGPGDRAMSARPDRYTCVPTLVHEIQHLKLRALLDLITLTLPDDGSRYYAPWRPDPRPVSGLLQGAYAFLAVSVFWRRQGQRCDDAAGQAAGRRRVGPERSKVTLHRLRRERRTASMSPTVRRCSDRFMAQASVNG
jgi:HEXXH motif-containing protein